MAKAAKMCQRVCKTRNIYKTNDKELFCLTYKEQIQNINDQIFKKQEKMVSLVKEMEGEKMREGREGERKET